MSAEIRESERETSESESYSSDMIAERGETITETIPTRARLVRVRVIVARP